MQLETNNKLHRYTIGIQALSGKSVSYCVIAILLVFSATAAASSVWISGKAVVAQHLLQIAWTASRETGQAIKPWPWADTRAVAKLTLPASGRSMIVLDGSHGEAMAFGPGKIHFQTQNNGLVAQLIAIGGHRDTHLGFLQQLKTGETLIVETLGGQTLHFALDHGKVVDTNHETLMVDPAAAGLLLITCYPFDATQTGGPLRYVALATVIEN